MYGLELHDEGRFKAELGLCRRGGQWSGVARWDNKSSVHTCNGERKAPEGGREWASTASLMPMYSNIFDAMPAHVALYVLATAAQHRRGGRSAAALCCCARVRCLRSICAQDAHAPSKCLARLLCTLPATHAVPAARRTRVLCRRGGGGGGGQR